MTLIQNFLVLSLGVFIFLACIICSMGIYRTWKAIIADTKTCEFTPVVDSDIYRTQCGKQFYNADDSCIVSDWAKFCPYCGGLIIEKSKSDA